MPGQLADESIDEYHQWLLAQLALVEAEVQRQVAAEAARLQTEAEAAAEKQRLQAEAEADAQALRREAQELLQHHEATSIDKLKFWHFEPSAGQDNATPEEQHKEFFSKLFTRLVYACNHQQSELEKQHQEFLSLRRAMQNHKDLHEDATRALHSHVQDLEQAAPRPDAGESSNASSTRQLEERADHVVAMLGDISTFAAPATISEQLGTLQTELRQLHQLPDNDRSTSKHYKMPTFRIEKFDDHTHQDPVAAMTTEFRHMLDKFVLVYLDDILVYSRSLDEHVEHMRTVLARLRQAKYKANRDKCKFVRQELEYLGHFVTPQGICPRADKIEVIRVWPEPTNTTTVRSFMGLAGYYQRFITGYSRIAAPLTRLQSPKVPFVFDDEARRSFQALKTAMLMASVLRIYEPTLPTRVTTDVSGYGIGAVLEQHDGNDWHLVECFSHKVPPINSLDDARKKELLAFVMALKRWWHFLLGHRRFT
ncbi:hypothetical protein CBR_g32100 [Chara braunii]|uniref:Reverse transcriptase domain-containing protein n=1 Tax=Chara braunii TaxID=69332 RepID=A0A388LGS8_CHABU|nr:hypothetical protein CBR_g32100 [Chara braunii]|eukprot:GBG81423.1 hypothetical protein CBR_g32100 [Chara braunii]